MIYELISTSAPRCLDGNAGFGVVAQTVGMTPNVRQSVNALSGYSHIAAPGSGKNPVIFLHVTRKTAGVQRHIVSRVADCGNDYSGRSNRIAHHWILETGDVRSLPGGPAELAAQDIFCSQWQEKSTELYAKQLSVDDVPPKKCTVWERLTGDAGWGGIVAERAERGDPISILFSPEYAGESLRTLIAESLALLSSSVRWRITFSTFFMQSHESGGERVQIKCFLTDSKESQFSRQSSNTLVIDLCRHMGAAPAGKYVEWARGTVNPPPRMPSDTKVPAKTSAPSLSQINKAVQQVTSKKSQAEEVPVVENAKGKKETLTKETLLKHRRRLVCLSLLLFVAGITLAVVWAVQNGELTALKDRSGLNQGISNQEITKLEKEISHINAEKEEITQLLKSRTSEFIKKIEELTSEVTGLRNDLRNRDNELTQEKEKAKQLEVEKKKLEDEIERLKDELRQVVTPPRNIEELLALLPKDQSVNKIGVCQTLF